MYSRALCGGATVLLCLALFPPVAWLCATCDEHGTVGLVEPSLIIPKIRVTTLLYPFFHSPPKLGSSPMSLCVLPLCCSPAGAVLGWGVSGGDGSSFGHCGSCVHRDRYPRAAATLSLLGNLLLLGVCVQQVYGNPCSGIPVPH